MTSEKFRPTWFNNMTLKETHNEYKVYEYINLDIYTTPDNNFFNATRLLALLSMKKREDGTKSPSKSMTSLMSSKKWQLMYNKHPELFKEVKGKGTKPYKGIYLQWILFSTFIGYASAGADINFELGEPIVEITEGYIYMCIPEKCEGTDTVKFGRTWNWKQRLNGYGINTELYYLVPVPNMYLEEEKMLKYMSSMFPQDTKYGDEYFVVKTCEEINKIERYFNKVCNEFNTEDVSREYYPLH